MELDEIIKGLEDLSAGIRKDRALRVIQKAIGSGEISEDVLIKAKYIRRTGTKGNYKYVYTEGHIGRGKRKDIKDFGKRGGKELTAEELESLQNYTLENYRVVNRELRSSKMSKETNRQVNQINSSLNKLPKFKGIVYRGMSMPDNMDQVLVDWQKGKMIVMDSFTSTSSKESVSKDFGDFKIKLKSKTGANIQSVSESEGEAEVLFKTSTKFKVKSIKVKKMKTPFGERVMSVNAVLEEV